MSQLQELYVTERRSLFIIYRGGLTDTILSALFFPFSSQLSWCEKQSSLLNKTFSVHLPFICFLSPWPSSWIKMLEYFNSSWTFFIFSFPSDSFHKRWLSLKCMSYVTPPSSDLQLFFGENAQFSAWFRKVLSLWPLALAVSFLCSNDTPLYFLQITLLPASLTLLIFPLLVLLPSCLSPHWVSAKFQIFTSCITHFIQTQTSKGPFIDYSSY